MAQVLPPTWKSDLTILFSSPEPHRSSSSLTVNQEIYLVTLDDSHFGSQLQFPRLLIKSSEHQSNMSCADDFIEGSQTATTSDIPVTPSAAPRNTSNWTAHDYLMAYPDMDDLFL